jgi:hypothetical protein
MHLVSVEPIDTVRVKGGKVLAYYRIGDHEVRLVVASDANPLEKELVVSIDRTRARRITTYV